MFQEDYEEKKKLMFNNNDYTFNSKEYNYNIFSQAINQKTNNQKKILNFYFKIK